MHRVSSRNTDSNFLVLKSDLFIAEPQMVALTFWTQFV